MLLAACIDQAGSTAEPGQEPDNSLLQVISGEDWYRERIMVTRQGRDQTNRGSVAPQIAPHAQLLSRNGRN